jgi:hypothetical protein
MSTPSNSAYGFGAAKTKAHWLAVKNAMHFSSSLPRSPTRKSSSAMSIYRYQFKQDLRSRVIFITNRTERASLRVGAADEAIHVYHHLKMFWIASCCVPRSRNDDLSCAFCDGNHPSAQVL